MTTEIRPLGEDDLVWFRALMDERWGGEVQVVNGAAFRPAEQQGFVAMEGDRRVGVVTYETKAEAAVCTIGLLQSLEEGRGIGAELVETVAALARERGCAHVRVVTTNDNARAKRLYERLGFRVLEVRPGAVDRSRAVKPAIPLVGVGGVEMHDEIELALDLA